MKQAQRMRAARVALRQVAPEKSLAGVFALDAEGCTAWLWEADRVGALLAAANVAAADVILVSETLMQSPGKDGCRLLNLGDGFEAQRWEQGRLLASRWWQTEPDDIAWMTFMRSAGIAPEAKPRAIQVDQIARPILRVVPLDASGHGPETLESWAYTALVAVAGAALAAQAIDVHRIDQAKATHLANIQSLQQGHRRAVRLRQGLDDDQARLAVLNTLDRYPNQMVVMEKIGHELNRAGVSVRTWEYSDGRVKLLVASPVRNLAAASLLDSLRHTGILTDITVLPMATPQQLQFSAALIPSVPVRKKGDT
ncbi:MAG: hypothetical protein JO142_10045 [Burkholderiales bacterium]|nr:hypothetical protein [Burkholderiales bacterium]